MKTNDNSYYGFYRAKVINNKDPDKYGKVLVWIPDLMPKIDASKGIWALPANTPIGGRNKEDNCNYIGSCLIPPIGSQVLIFFEAGNISRPFYFASLELENTKVLPENQLGENYESKWVIFKSGEGRCIVISDDGDDARVEITGKKRNITNAPNGDTDSVYEIDENQTTILLDERDDKEKILMRSYMGDFIHFDINERTLQIEFENDIYLKSKKGKIILETEEDNIELKSVKDIKIQSKENISLKCTENLSIESGENTSIKTGNTFNLLSIKDIKNKSGGNISNSADGNINTKAGGNINNDGALMNDQSGMASPDQPNISSITSISSPEVEGERDT